MYARGCTAQLDASAKPPCFTHSAILSLSRARACAAFYRCNVTPVVTLRSFRTMTRWCQESFLARVLVAALLISLLHPTQAHAVPEYEPSKTPDHDDGGGRNLLGPEQGVPLPLEQPLWAQRQQCIEAPIREEQCRVSIAAEWCKPSVDTVERADSTPSNHTIAARVDAKVSTSARNAACR